MKIPFPKYDAETVGAVEDYLCLDEATRIEREDILLVVNNEVVLKALCARGRGQRNHNRPMFQVLPEGVFSGEPTSYAPCEACDRFDRSWNCEEHPEVAWDYENHRWNRIPEAPTAYYSESDRYLQPEPVEPRLEARLLVAPYPLSQAEADDYRVVVDPAYLEITGDTVQDAPALRIRVERDGTP